MNYSLVKINTFYEDYLADYYGRYPATKTKGYREQYENLVGDRFAWGNYFERHLKTLDIDTHEIYENVIPLQNAWARENGVLAVGEDLLVAQLRKYRPDVIFSEYVNFLAPGKLVAIRELVPSVRLMCAHFCAPLSEKVIQGLRAYDLVFTCTPGFVEYFRSIGLKAFLLNHAFEPANLLDIKKNNNMPKSDFLFAGSLLAHEEYHKSRLDLIERLLNDGVKMRIYSNLPKRTPFQDHARKVFLTFSDTTKALGLDSFAIMKRIGKRADSLRSDYNQSPYSTKLLRVAKRPIYGITMFRALSRAKIVFNSHIGSAGRYAGNMRLFEGTGCGTCLVTDWKENLKDLFEPDYEVVSYGSQAECAEKIKWLLDHPKNSAQIAEAGQKRCLRDHTFFRRVNEFHKIVSRSLT